MSETKIYKSTFIYRIISIFTAKPTSIIFCEDNFRYSGKTYNAIDIDNIEILQNKSYFEANIICSAEKLVLGGLDQYTSLELSKHINHIISKHKYKKIEKIHENIDNLISSISTMENSYLIDNYFQQKYFSQYEWDRLCEIVTFINNKLYKENQYFINESIAKTIENYNKNKELNDNIINFIKLSFEQKVDAKYKGEFNKVAKEKLLKEWKELFDTVEKYPLTTAQREACVINEDNTLVVAGAGSGKTSTIISKCIYLLKAGLVEPEQILLLAFGRDAANEMSERIAKKLGDGAKSVTATTFHAFGLSVLSTVQGYTANITNFEEQPYLLTKWLNKTVEKLAEKDIKYLNKLLDFLGIMQIPNKDKFSFESAEDYANFQHNYPLVTYKFERVKSRGELEIANTLYKWNIKYKYEETYPYFKGRYKPDFTVYYEDGKPAFWIEYLALDENDLTPSYIDNHKYLAALTWKRKLHARNNTEMIEIKCPIFWEDRLEETLKKALIKHKFNLRTKPVKEILQDIGKNEHFTKQNIFFKILNRFMTLYKARNIPLDKIPIKNKSSDINRIKTFFYLFKPVYDEYRKLLEEKNEIDFSDMIRKATDAISKGEISLPYKYILVDEFQDLAVDRKDFITAIAKQNPGSRIFGVGDDWQSILRFTGSDLSYFIDFSSYFEPGTILYLDRTYRFNDRINELSSKFITQNPKQFKKSIQTHTKTDSAPFHIRSVGNERSNNSDNIKPDYINLREAILGCLNEIKNLTGEKKTSVFILGRRRLALTMGLSENDIRDFSNEFKSFDITYMTAHKSKGLEADYVILINIDNETFPDPRLDDEILDLLLPTLEDYDFAEERRLFYVALTRAKNKVFMLFHINAPSPFINEIRKENIRYINQKNIYLYKCPSCNSGTLNRYETSNGYFWVCHHCESYYQACKECGQPLDDYTNKSGRFCLNKKCHHIDLHCPQCKSGWLVMRTNSKTNENFYGCTNWSPDNAMCKCTYNLDDYNSLLDNFRKDTQGINK